jgi:threonyl-tRNA synthetase
MLNNSVDSSDPCPVFTAEDLSMNDQESVIELIVETVMGFEDAIAELDDNDAQEQLSKNPFKTHLIAESPRTAALMPQHAVLSTSYSASQIFPEQFHPSPEPPPPRT